MSATILPVDFPEYIYARPERAFKVAINGQHAGFVYSICERWYTSNSTLAWDKYGHSYLKERYMSFPTLEAAVEAV